MHTHYCVRLRGLPPRTNFSELKAFLSPIDVDEGSVRLHSKERRTGEALVVFSNNDDATSALGKDQDFFNEERFGQRFVRVSSAGELSPEESAWLAQVQQLHSRPMPSDAAVKVNGLPANISIPEVVQLFYGTRASHAGTVVKRNATQAQAFLDFGDPEHAARAVTTWNGTVMTTHAGVFPLSVQQIPRHEWAAAAAEAAAADEAPQPAAAPGGDAVLRVRGLPIRAATADVAAFFSGYKVCPGGVYVQPISENRHSKVAYVEFESAAEAARAMAERDHQPLGKAFGERYCLVQRATRADMQADVARVASLGAASTQPRVHATTSIATATHGNGGVTSTGTAPSSAATATTSMSHPYYYGMAPAAATAGGRMPAAAAAATYMMPGSYGAPAWPGMPGMPPMMATMQAMPFFVPGMQGYPGMAWPMQMPAMQAPTTVAARYMVQDLTTGQRVYLDPRFNHIYPTSAGGMAAPAPTMMGGSSGFNQTSGAPVAVVPAAPAVADPIANGSGSLTAHPPLDELSGGKLLSVRVRTGRSAAAGATERRSKSSEPTEERSGTDSGSNEGGSDDGRSVTAFEHQRGSTEEAAAAATAATGLLGLKSGGKRVSVDLPEDCRPQAKFQHTE